MARSKEVIMIGGGVSDLGMAVQPKRPLGHDNFTICGKSDNIGGTWWHNRYPACACDIPIYTHQISFKITFLLATTTSCFARDIETAKGSLSGFCRAQYEGILWACGLLAARSTGSLDASRRGVGLTTSGAAPCSAVPGPSD
jgi:hypothetical protein